MYEFKGTHIMLDFVSIPHNKLIEVEKLMQAVKDGITKSGAHIIETYAHYFDPSGMSLVFILEESHVAIHTYPEYCCAFADIFTCGKCNASLIDDALCVYLNGTVKMRQIAARGFDL